MIIDWSKAPEGATHYYTRGDTPWRDLSGENWKWWADGKWHSDNAVSASIDRSSQGFLERRCVELIPRPAADLKEQIIDEIVRDLDVPRAIAARAYELGYRKVDIG